MLNAIRLAVGTFTAIPVAPPRSIDARVAGGAIMLAPMAALPLAVVAGGVVLAGDAIGLPAPLTAVSALGAVALGTRGLHLDGLADTADGLACTDRAKALEVMRRGDIGPMGTAALVFVLLAQVGALTGAIAAGRGVLAIAVAVLVSRLVLAGCCAKGVPAAKPGGLGATVAGTVPAWLAAAAITGGVVLAAVAGMLAELPWWRGALAAVLAMSCAGALLARSWRRLGGITGDVLGGCVEAATLGALVALAT